MNKVRGPWFHVQEQQAKIQHTGPFGQYRIPENPRFKFDEKLRRGISLTHQIEIVGEKHSTSEMGTTVRTYFSYQGNEYCLSAISNVDLMPDGDAAVRVIDGKTMPGYNIWYDVEFISTIRIGDAKPKPYTIQSLDDEFTDLVMEYLAINYRNYNQEKTVRVVFKDNQPIAIKNWEVTS